MIPLTHNMDPEERADYFTSVDKLEPEKINESVVVDYNKIP